MKNSINKRYKWVVDKGFSLKELSGIYQTGMDIERYADNLTGGGGLAWMNRNMGRTLIAHPGVLNQIPLSPFAGHNTSWPYLIFMQEPGSNKEFDKPGFAHELAEIWDFHSSSNMYSGGYYNGVADHLNMAMGGDIISDPYASRFTNNGNLGNMPIGNQWTHNPYANSATEDYFSESFSHMIYPSQNGGPIPNGVQTWLDQYIKYGPEVR